MAWPYHFVDLNSDEKERRRQLLDQYALYSQLSALIPILGYGLYRLGKWLLTEKQGLDVAYSALEQSPVRTRSIGISSSAAARRWRSIKWWLNDEIAPNFGLRGRWIAAGMWMVWLLFLCTHQTGHDYLHITKRFGIVAAAQLPFHYLLSMRTRYSPLALALGTSHEQLIHWHQLSGRVVLTLIALHATWYITFFVQKEILIERLRELPSITGLFTVALLVGLAGTSLETVRQWSYRVFYFCHIAIGLGILPILLLHAKPLRVYAIEALGLFILNQILRRLDTATEYSTITRIPHTNLVKVQTPIPPLKSARFRANPGQHVYVRIPSPSDQGGKNALLSNPFTVADISASHITLVLRVRRGPTTQTLSTYMDRFKTSPQLSIEGPYGPSTRIADLLKFDRILLVAGGIGGTFILPIYQALHEQLQPEPGGAERLNLIWALRSAADAGWVTDTEEQIFAQNSNVQIYLTRQDPAEQSFNDVPFIEGMELDGLYRPGELVGGVKAHMGRPDLADIVDQTFNRHAEDRVAVLFCGPQDMGRQLRFYVSRWVARGRYVLWHEEGFGA